MKLVGFKFLLKGGFTMGHSGWFWNDHLGNWVHVNYGESEETGAPDAPSSYYTPTSEAPQYWIDEHPGWTPVWHDDLYTGLYPGGWVWQPPTPEPLSDTGHWEWHWVDGDSDYSPGYVGRDAFIAGSDDHWEWRWVED